MDFTKHPKNIYLYTDKEFCSLASAKNFCSPRNDLDPYKRYITKKHNILIHTNPKNPDPSRLSRIDCLNPIPRLRLVWGNLFLRITWIQKHTKQKIILQLPRSGQTNPGDMCSTHLFLPFGKKNA